MAHSADMKYQDRIVIQAGVRSGKPCIRGTRITVYDVFDYLAGGTTQSELLEQFPDLTDEDIQACYAYASEREKQTSLTAHEAVA